MMKALSLGGSLLWGRTVQGQQVLSGRWPSKATQYPADSREHGHSMWSGGRTVAPHVCVHLREARLDVGLCAALPHGAEAEALGRVVQLRRRSAQPAACAPTRACLTSRRGLPQSSDAVPSAPQVLHLGTPETLHIFLLSPQPQSSPHLALAISHYGG